MKINTMVIGALSIIMSIVLFVLSFKYQVDEIYVYLVENVIVEQMAYLHTIVKNWYSREYPTSLYGLWLMYFYWMEISIRMIVFQISDFAVGMVIIYATYSLDMMIAIASSASFFLFKRMKILF